MLKKIINKNPAAVHKSKTNANEAADDKVKLAKKHKVIDPNVDFVPGAMDSFGAIGTKFDIMLKKMAAHSASIEQEEYIRYKMGSRGAYFKAMHSKIVHNLKIAVYKWTAATILGYAKKDMILRSGMGNAVVLRANRMDPHYLDSIRPSL